MSANKPIVMFFHSFDEAVAAAELLTPLLIADGYDFFMSPSTNSAMWKAEIREVERCD